MGPMSEPARTRGESGSPIGTATVRVFYQLLYLLLLLLASPFLIVKMLRRGQWRQGFAQRFGHYGPDLVEKYTSFLEAQFAAHQALATRLSAGGETVLTPEQLQALRALGYIQ